MNKYLLNVLNGFIKLASSGESDGFFWPGEFGQAKEVDGLEPFQSYHAPGGTLFMLPEKYRLYGYKNEGSFESDCRKGKLHAKTLAGVLTLGALRIVPSDATSVDVNVFVPESVGRFVFHAASQEEAASVVDMIRAHIPAAKAALSNGALEGLLAGTPSGKQVLAGFHSIRKSEARWLFFLQIAIACAVVMLIAAAWVSFHPFLYMAAICLTGVFVWVSWVAASRSSALNSTAR